MSGRFGDIVFDQGFLTATRLDGDVVRFTRRERALLGVLAASPGRLFTRDALCEALDTRGSDRNVDFVINRLRAKLGDTGPTRRLISTQYGEGYVWVAEPTPEPQGPAFFVIGPVRSGGGPRGLALLDALVAALAARLGPEHRVLADPAEAGAAARFAIEASVHAVGGRLEAAFVLRDGATGQTVATLRDSVAEGAEEPAAAALAGRLTQAAWAHVALPPAATPAPTDPPLHLRLHAAALLMDGTGAAWIANETQIAALRLANPADPQLAIIWAMHRFGRMTLGAEALDPQTDATFCDEIEGLVLGALPAVRDDPVMALAAAKLLLSSHRGHDALAETLATSAFAESAAFGAAFPMLGQIKACRGDLAEGVRLFDEGLALCAPGSPFESYIQVLKGSTLVAAEDWPGVEAVYDRLEEITPEALPGFALMFLPAGDDGLARRLAPLADRVTAARARWLIDYLHYRVARYFRVEAHAANVMRGPLVHLVRRFGPDVVSDAIWRETPRELRHLRRPARVVSAS